MKKIEKGILNRASALTALAMAMLAPIAAHANTCTVTSPGDSGPGTLRALIADTTCDLINFGSLSLPATITLTSGELYVARNVTINGPGASQLTLKRDANAPAFGILYIDSGTVTINGLTIANGAGGNNSFYGGIAVISATVTLNGSTVSGNTGGFLAAGIVNFGTMNLVNCTISGNSSENGGGGISNSGQMTLSGSTVSGNQSGDVGGGIVNLYLLTITNSTISGNVASGGAGIFNNYGQVTITGSTISGNTATFSGGGIYNDGVGDPAPTITLVNSTVSANTITILDFNTAVGGGIFTGAGNLQVINSTVSGNTGGGLFAQSGTTICSTVSVVVTDSTFSANTSGNTMLAGSIINSHYSGCQPSSVTIRNTILATGSGQNCWTGPSVIGFINDPITDGGYNLENGYTCGFTAASSKPSTDPLLGPLQDNGGPTATQALLPGSPAIDTGSCTDLNGNTVATDQRGAPRPQGSGCDMGSFEYRPPYPFTGFFQPVDNPPTKNVVKAGAAVPVKFNLGGYRGLDIFAANSPSSVGILCDFTSPSSDIQTTVAAGSSSLSYDPLTGTYSYIWKTDNAWAGSCRQLTLKLNDYTTHVANFQFK